MTTSTNLIIAPDIFVNPAGSPAALLSRHPRLRCLDAERRRCRRCTLVPAPSQSTLLSCSCVGQTLTLVTIFFFGDKSPPQSHRRTRPRQRQHGRGGLQVQITGRSRRGKARVRAERERERPKEVGGEYTVYRTTHNAIIVLQVLNKSRALSAECLLVRVHSVLSSLKCARFAVH